jgi:hypothetical protein
MSTTTTNNNAETFKVTGDWAAQSKNLKERFTTLTDADLKYEPGKEIDLLKRVENRLNKDRAAVLSILRSAEHPRKTEGPATDPAKQ